MKRMAITSETLQTPEQGLKLENREKRTEKRPTGRQSAAEARDEAEELRKDLGALRERVAEVRTMPLPRGEFYCADCYRRALADAADHIEGKPRRRENPDRDRP